MYRIGIDIGGTTIKAGIVESEGNLVYKLIKTTVKESETAFIRAIVEIVEDILKGALLTYKDIEYMGIGCPGIIDSSTGVIVNAGNLGLSNFPIKERLESILPLSVVVNNDANCAALGEYNSIGDRNINSFVMLTLGTGIGGGIILDHKIYEGCDGSAGEFGNMVIYTEGQRAWWEEYASAQALVKMAQKAAIEHKDSLLYTLMGDNGGKINGEIVFKALEEQDCIAESVFEEYIKYLGEGLINIIYIFRPDVLVIGGGLSEGEALWRPLEKYIAENSNWMHREKRTQIRRARLGNDAGIIGATYLKNNV